MIARWRFGHARQVEACRHDRSVVGSWLVALGTAWSTCAAQGTPGTPYRDRVLDEGPQPQLRSEDSLRAYDSAGWPRGLRTEVSVAADRGSVESTGLGLVVTGWLDTPNHGSLSVDASLNSARQRLDTSSDSTSSRSSRWRIDQRQLPMEGGWLASQAAGHINTTQVPLTYAAGRVFLPSSPMLGVSTAWQRGIATSFNASAGRYGLFSGETSTSFQDQNGQVLSAGVQHALALPERVGAPPLLQLATQFVQALDQRESGPDLRRDTRSLWLAVAGAGRAPWTAAPAAAPGAVTGGSVLAGLPASGDWQWQANALASTSRLDGSPDRLGDAGAAASAQGWWADATWRQGALLQNLGAFRYEPGLRWGAYVAASDLQGLYWRGDWTSRQWQLAGTLEHASSVSGQTAATDFASASARYRIDTRQAIGAYAAWRGGSGAGQALQFTWDRRTDLGQTQWRLEGSRAPGRRLVRLAVDQQWRLAGWRSLGTSLGIEREHDGPLSRQRVSWGLLLGRELGNNLALDASLRGSFGDGRQLVGNLGALWQVRPGWTLVVQASASRGEEPQAPLLTSALTDATTQAAPAVTSQRRIALILRYEERAGTARAPIGGLPGAGAGEIVGEVFFDSDRNGRRDPQEAGLAGVVVLLNRRFSARTDERGRYAFPAVAAGEHSIELVPDNIPLPWSPVAREPIKLRVGIRAATQVDLPLVRDP